MAIAILLGAFVLLLLLGVPVAFALAVAGESIRKEVTLRRHLAREVVAIITQAEVLKGQERTDFVKTKMEALQQDVLARRAA